MPIYITVAGWVECPWYQKALRLAEKLVEADKNLRLVRKEIVKEGYRKWIRAHKYTGSFTESPSVFLDNGTGAQPESNHIGGFEALEELAKRPSFTWFDDDDSGAVYDYDLVVIGGGSGGLACAKEAAGIKGTKVAVLDFIKPSPKGSTWGLGGTCVNVGCIPKKLMHTAALYGETMHDAQDYGWSTGKPSLKWETLRANVQKHIHNMNDGYIAQLHDKKVKYYNALGSFKDKHTVNVNYGNGSHETITARNIVVAVGGRPYALGCPGEEHAISSDDLFNLKKAPGKTLVVGASYVALECAGFLSGIGFDTKVMVRSIILRGFDQECGNRIAEYMNKSGTPMIRSATVSKIEKRGDRLLVSWSKNDSARGRHERPAGSDGSEEFDTVMAAVGRYIDTKGLNCEAVGLKLNKKGEFVSGPFGMESTNVSNIFAIGDCLEGSPELTPVAIQAGRYLARRLFDGSTVQMPYQNVATAVFTPIEYGSVGLSEDAVLEDSGTASADKHYVADPAQTYRYHKLKPGYVVYRKEFTPLEWKIVKARKPFKCYMKIICEGTDERIVGIHYLGPNAGEIMQGFSLAVRMGAKYSDLHDTVGIHPTSVEHFTILEKHVEAPKSKLMSAAAAACDT